MVGRMNQGAVDLEDNTIKQQLPWNFVDVVLVSVLVCVYACVLQAAVGTTLDELSCLICDCRENARKGRLGVNILVSTSWCSNH